MKMMALIGNFVISKCAQYAVIMIWNVFNPACMQLKDKYAKKKKNAINVVIFQKIVQIYANKLIKQIKATCKFKNKKHMKTVI